MCFDEFSASIYELGIIRNETEYFMKHLKEFAAPDKLPLNALAILDSGCVSKQPYGVVLILGK